MPPVCGLGVGRSQESPCHTLIHTKGGTFRSRRGRPPGSAPHRANVAPGPLQGLKRGWPRSRAGHSPTGPFQVAPGGGASELAHRARAGPARTPALLAAKTTENLLNYPEHALGAGGRRRGGAIARVLRLGVRAAAVLLS